MRNLIRYIRIAITQSESFPIPSLRKDQRSLISRIDLLKQILVMLEHMETIPEKLVDLTRFELPEIIFTSPELVKRWLPPIELTVHKKFNIVHVLMHPEIPWDFDNLIQNPRITVQNILDTPYLRWNLDFISRNPNFTDLDRLKFLSVADTPQLEQTESMLPEKFSNVTLQEAIDNPNYSDWSNLSRYLKYYN